MLFFLSTHARDVIKESTPPFQYMLISNTVLFIF